MGRDERLRVRHVVLRIRDEGCRIIDRDIGYGLMDEMRGYKCGM